MRLFKERQIDEALAYSEAGGQALHVWDPGPNHGYHQAPMAFKRNRPWAHLFDQDKQRLVQTVRKLGVRVVAIGRKGGRGQHVDLCAGPLRRAIERCEQQEMF